MAKKSTVKNAKKAPVKAVKKKSEKKVVAKSAKPSVKAEAVKSTKTAAKGKKSTVLKTVKDNFGGLSKEILLQIHEMMVKSRILEERIIKIYKAGEGYFWIGGPGEEAWGVTLGLLGHKGQGLNYDWWHLHYRCTPTMVAMGMEMIDAVRLMMNRSTDPSTGGRNFASHYCFPKWNVAPVTSPLEVQYPIACGTAHAQKRIKSKGISIVTGGDAGTAEGDFASSLILASRKGQELPMLITVQNNGFGISTPFEGQHGETHIADRARAFNIRARTINGNDPVECYLAIKEEMDYIRKTGKPSFIEAMVTRLYGHSSADGANKKSHLFDPVTDFQNRLLAAGYLDDEQVQMIWDKYEDEGKAAQELARSEPVPTSESVWDHVYVNNENADWRKF